MNKNITKNSMKKSSWFFGVILAFIIIGIGVVVISSPPKDGNEAQSEKENTHNQQQDNTNHSEEEKEDKVEIIKQENAEYEKWLAAAMLIGLSIEYPDFKSVEIYTKSTTSLDDHDASKGVYIFFENNGDLLAVHSRPLKDERTEEGTIDLGTKNLGFATFDMIERNKVSLNKLQSIDVNELDTLLSQTMLCTLYRH